MLKFFSFPVPTFSQLDVIWLFPNKARYKFARLKLLVNTNTQTINYSIIRSNEKKARDEMDKSNGVQTIDAFSLIVSFGTMMGLKNGVEKWGSHLII